MLTLDIAMAHLAGRKRQTIMSLIGVTLGVAFFIGVSSMMRGSENDFINRMINSNDHISIEDDFREARTQPLERWLKANDPKRIAMISGLKPVKETRGIATYRQIYDYLKTVPNLKFFGSINTNVIVRSSGSTDRSLRLRGADPDDFREMTVFGTSMVQGRLENLKYDSNGIILGKYFTDQERLNIGDSVDIISTGGGARSMKLVGIFETGSRRNDMNTALANLKKVQVLASRPNRITGITIKLDDPYSAWEEAVKIESMFGYRTESWQEMSQDLLNTMATRNMIMYAVVGSILLVASLGIYNIISTVVMEKTKDIAILKSMGFTKNDIVRIFMLEGFLVGLSGALSGCALGRFFLHLLSTIKIRMPGMGRGAGLPLDYGIEQFLFVSSIAIGAAVIASWLPARKAGALPPVDILRGAA